MPGSIQSLKKAARILNLFTQDCKFYGITDIAKKLNLPKPTVQSLVRTLEEIGYLEKDPLTSKYMLGPALFQLGMKFIATMDLAVIARVWMERLCRQFDEAVHVGMMVGTKVVIVLRADPASRYMVFPQAGSVIPVHTSGIGKILLAFMEEDRRDEVLAECSYPRLTERSIDNRADFLSELERVRSDSIAFDREESLTGLSCVSGPVFNNKGQCLAAFSVSGNAQAIETKREEIISAVRYVSSQISSQLGYRREY
ncbi:MAG TPA: IclR family transcriptional regulator [Spirochaetota bacterium]|nr:IclR family transcriptional regulator [Spirochaetota bacterium]HPL18405.1 IclR family transcriptional regulator [Spirochaetota bacterium]HQF07966.1 IclR family transcriptional regulator [Spirochaetota bacterium]HQH96526.1 IclR family transcriptional regulator [Spirochaetota bacterium]HQJ69698.1 IclR family transcriptional regulator [Spirochaetota bacterium]